MFSLRLILVGVEGNRPDILIYFIRMYLSVKQTNDAVSMHCNVFLVCNQNDGVTFSVNLLNQAHDFVRSLGVKIPCRLICQQD